MWWSIRPAISSIPVAPRPRVFSAGIPMQCRRRTRRRSALPGWGCDRCSCLSPAARLCLAAGEPVRAGAFDQVVVVDPSSDQGDAAPGQILGEHGVLCGDVEMPTVRSEVSGTYRSDAVSWQEERIGDGVATCVDHSHDIGGDVRGSLTRPPVRRPCGRSAPSRLRRDGRDSRVSRGAIAESRRPLNLPWR